MCAKRSPGSFTGAIPQKCEGLTSPLLYFAPLQDSFFTSYLNRTNIQYAALLPGSVNTQLGYKAIYGMHRCTLHAGPVLHPPEPFLHAPHALLSAAVTPHLQCAHKRLSVQNVTGLASPAPSQNRGVRACMQNDAQDALHACAVRQMERAACAGCPELYEDASSHQQVLQDYRSDLGLEPENLGEAAYRIFVNPQPKARYLCISDTQFPILVRRGSLKVPRYEPQKGGSPACCLTRSLPARREGQGTMAGGALGTTPGPLCCECYG